MSDHPSYKNPTIQEALCEIHFRSRAGSDWSPNKPSPLIEILKDQYPELETLTEQGLEIIPNPQGVLVPQFQSRLKLVFKHKSRPLLLQFWQGTFTINATRHYEGWDKLKEELLTIWPKAAQVLQPEAITRMGMRYINRIERRARDELLGHWFKESPYFPSKLLQSGPNFANRLEARLDAANRLITTVAHDTSNPAESFGSIVFDIDRIAEREIPIDAHSVGEAAHALHEDIWEVFRSAKNDQLETLLRGEL